MDQRPCRSTSANASDFHLVSKRDIRFLPSVSHDVHRRCQGWAGFLHVAPRASGFGRCEFFFSQTASDALGRLCSRATERARRSSRPAIPLAATARLAAPDVLGRLALPMSRRSDLLDRPTGKTRRGHHRTGSSRNRSSTPIVENGSMLAPASRASCGALDAPSHGWPFRPPVIQEGSAPSSESCWWGSFGTGPMINVGRDPLITSGPPYSLLSPSV